MQHDIIYKRWMSAKALKIFFFMIDWWSNMMLLNKKIEKKAVCLQ